LFTTPPLFPPASLTCSLFSATSFLSGRKKPVTLTVVRRSLSFFLLGPSPLHSFFLRSFPPFAFSPPSLPSVLIVETVTLFTSSSFYPRFLSFFFDFPPFSPCEKFTSPEDFWATTLFFSPSSIADYWLGPLFRFGPKSTVTFPGPG